MLIYIILKGNYVAYFVITDPCKDAKITVTSANTNMIRKVLVTRTPNPLETDPAWHFQSSNGVFTRTLDAYDPVKDINYLHRISKVIALM